MIRRCGAAAILVAAALAASPVAQADNQSYLDVIHTRLTAERGDHGLLSAGKTACFLLTPRAGYPWGVNANEVADFVWTNNPDMERGEAAFLVNTAIDNLCPHPNIYGYAAG